MVQACRPLLRLAIEDGLPQPFEPRPPSQAVQINAGTMPSGPKPVNDGPGPSLIGLNYGGSMPLSRFRPSNQTVRTAQDYGLSAARHELRLDLPRGRKAAGYKANSLLRDLKTQLICG